MEFLWQKESTNEDALYCDFLVHAEYLAPKSNTSRLMSDSDVIYEWKNNTISKSTRKAGNAEFKNNEYTSAINYYNKALCLAETGTESLALAYGNRSTCYYALNRYDECLADIAITLNEPGCTENLRETLENRRAECLEYLSERIPKVELKYRAQRNFPEMADCVKIKTNTKFGRHMVATDDIPTGELISFEDNFVSFTRPNHLIAKYDGIMRCIACNKMATNAIPCDKCTVVMFCGKKCKDENIIHNMDCGTIYYTYDNSDSKYIIQSVLAAMILFKNFDAFKEFVEHAVNADKLEPLISVNDGISKYRMFLKLWMPPQMENFTSLTLNFFNTIMSIELIQNRFNTEAKRRFLMHLVGHHAVILRHNSMNGQLSLFATLLRHSCTPNVQVVWIDNRTACIAIKPIRKGEQICCAYTTGKQQSHDLRKYMDVIKDKSGFRCTCVKCENTLVDLKSIEDDLVFRLTSDMDLGDFETRKFQEFLINSVTLLNKYKHLPWSKQMDFISNRLGCCLEVFFRSMVEVK